MQFNHPEVLYALFLLIIPILIHFFQLRKFRRESFTNVKFLKRLTQQSRKSSRLKKWLVLATRLLLLASIIFAFARPYFPEEKIEPDTVETIVYIDNSYSMEAEGPRGRLLDRSVQELLENLPEERNFTLITNDDQFSNVSKQELQEIEFSANTLDFNTVILKAKSSFSKDPLSTKNLLLLSDFQENLEISLSPGSSDINIYALPKRPQRLENIRIDTLFQTGENLGARKLVVQVGYTGDNPGSVPVSFYDDEDLLGKSSVDFNDGNVQELEFPLDDRVILNGRIQIEDNGLQFDNNLYFTLNEVQPIKITSINEADPRFLELIFSSEELDFTPMPANEVDYNTLADAQVIILNELQDLSGSLLNTLIQKLERDAVFIVIPSSEEVGAGLQTFIRELGFPGFGERLEQEKLITGISFQHPLFSEVFEEEVRNFEYPKVQISYNFTGSNFASVLGFEDNSPFLAEAGGNFVFTAPLNLLNSNFRQSPLVVPSFYNMGASVLKSGQPYYLLGRTNRIEVPVELKGDEILQITSLNLNFIPQQQSFANKVEIITDELPDAPGNYNVMNNDDLIMGVSYNLHRKESDLSYNDLSGNEIITVVSNISEYFTSAGYNREDDSLWKWFVTFALILLFIETLLLKYLK